jgi:hypothetical protein
MKNYELFTTKAMALVVKYSAHLFWCNFCNSLQMFTSFLNPFLPSANFGKRSGNCGLICLILSRWMMMKSSGYKNHDRSGCRRQMWGIRTDSTVSNDWHCTDEFISRGRSFRLDCSTPSTICLRHSKERVLRKWGCRQQNPRSVVSRTSAPLWRGAGWSHHLELHISPKGNGTLPKRSHVRTRNKTTFIFQNFLCPHFHKTKDTVCKTVSVCFYVTRSNESWFEKVHLSLRHPYNFRLSFIKFCMEYPSCWRSKTHKRLWLENHWGRYNLGDRCVNWRIMLHRIL